MKVAIYGLSEAGLKGSRSDRGDRIGNCLADGFKVHGIDCSLHSRFEGVVADIALGYGWIHELREQVFSKYRAAGKHFVFFDLGYWNRGHKGAYRVGVDDWDTGKHMLRGCPDDRFRDSGLDLKSFWQPDSRDVMIVGMSEKAAPTHGYKFREWEDKTKRYLEDRYADSPYRFTIRAKPRGKDAGKAVPIMDALKTTRFVVSHHSNVTIEALIAGVPFTTLKGAARHVSPKGDPDNYLDDLDLDNPYFPSEEERIRFLNDVAYAQWTTEEMSHGLCWDYIQKVLEACA